MREFWQKIPLLWRLLPPALLLLLAGVALVQARPDGRLHLYFFDVGQGNAILVRTPAGRHLLIDGGGDPTALLENLGARLPFWERELDMVLLTETAPERMAGPVALVERYRAQVAGRPGRLRSGEGSTRWLALLDAQGSRVLPLQRGARLEAGDGVVLEVLHPEAEVLPGALPGGEDDALVLRLRYGRFCALLPTAAGPAAQEALRSREADLACDLLLVPRQAGPEVLDRRFLQAVRPALALVSTGSGYHQGPDARTLRLLREAGVPFYRTDLQGTIEVLSDGQRVWVRPERP